MRVPRPRNNGGILDRVRRMSPAKLVGLMVALYVCWLIGAAVFRRARDTGKVDPRANQMRDGVTLVTHLSLDRMPALRNIMQRWKGDAAIAFFVRNFTTELPQIEAFEREVIARHPGSIRFCIFASSSYQYPVNILRNRAMQLAETHLSFLLDVDFVPDDTLLDYFQEHNKELQAQMTDSVFVVPCFEHLGHPNSIPTTKKALLKAVDDKLTRPMFEGVDEVPHIRSTNYKFWYTADSMYDITYYHRYEPYVVASTLDVPQYDERFLYYGNDKIQHAYHLYQLGYKFKAIPNHFIVHYPHERSEWANNQVRDQDKVQALLNDFESKV